MPLKKLNEHFAQATAAYRHPTENGKFFVLSKNGAACFASSPAEREQQLFPFFNGPDIGEEALERLPCLSVTLAARRKPDTDAFETCAFSNYLLFYYLLLVRRASCDRKIFLIRDSMRCAF